MIARRRRAPAAAVAAMAVVAAVGASATLVAAAFVSQATPTAPTAAAAARPPLPRRAPRDGTYLAWVRRTSEADMVAVAFVPPHERAGHAAGYAGSAEVLVDAGPLAHLGLIDTAPRRFRITVEDGLLVDLRTADG